MSAAMAVDQYTAAFHQERLVEYPAIDAIEDRVGYALAGDRLRAAARVLACPVKKSPPNWQHGRVLYAMARHYLDGYRDEFYSRPYFKTGGVRLSKVPDSVAMLDIGTAKGFSALCMRWALDDAHAIGTVTSVDVLDPKERVSRNTVAEVDGLKTLGEILAPWPEAQSITFLKSTGQKWLQEHPERVHVAFVDGKHSYEAVSWEAALLAERQLSGDLVMFDDVQIDGVAKAVKELRAYAIEYVDVLPNRRYAIGVRK
jgi:predicted O-methyltransferase YrrM